MLITKSVEFTEGSLKGSGKEKNHFVKIAASLVTILLKMTLWLCIYFVFTKNPLF